MASSRDKNFDRRSKHDSQKLLNDNKTDSNNNQKKRGRGGNQRSDAPKSKKKRTSLSNLDENSKFLT